MPDRLTPPLAAWVSAAAQHRFATSVQGMVAPPGGVTELRAFYDLLNQARLAEALNSHAVEIEETVIAGVTVAIVRPRAGVRRPGALICLHGGAFMWGAGAGALIEAVPVSARSGHMVVAVDYRLAPEHLFPAAVEDAVAVHQALAEEHGAGSIGMYGCSAGGILTAQAVARLLRDRLPVPGAIAMLHGTGLELGGDSVAVAGLLNGIPDAALVPSLASLPFLVAADPHDPLVFPGEHATVLAGFPPSLLVTGTRDFAASAVSMMHRRLRSAGVAADLSVFDGMWHAHHVDTDLPEARETVDLLTRFFARNLAR